MGRYSGEDYESENKPLAGLVKDRAPSHSGMGPIEEVLTEIDDALERLNGSIDRVELKFGPVLGIAIDVSGADPRPEGKSSVHDKLIDIYMAVNRYARQLDAITERVTL
jgi:hypothetical protein